MNAEASVAAPPRSAIEVSLGAIAGNLAEIRRRIGPDRKVIAVVKADAYGHGVAAVAAALGEADYLAVGTIEDAARIRRAGIAAPVLLLGSLLPGEVDAALRLRVIPSLDSRIAADAVAARAGAPVPVFIKVDGGFRRFGVPLEDAAALIRHVASSPLLRLDGVYTHLPFADAEGRTWAMGRYAAFLALIDGLSAAGLDVPVTQALASPALACALADRCSAVAVGTLLFGLPPVGEALAGEADLSGFRPAVQAIRTTLVHVGPAHAADPAYPVGPATVTGVVPVGLAQGYQARLGPAAMLLDGRRVPLLRVCMESTILDLSAAPAPRIGAEVTIMGGAGPSAIPLAELAQWQGLGAVATLLRLGAGLPRRHLPV